ncbi:MAG: Gfo/Idh/MocA family oxidoreductase [Candidatus Pacebacteria bacterium]|nr:Gfo/Idh/MocA family oxidoreductase [Candidatus Paceibacterota bacterium]MDD2757190.1 Gfo/Idh/MocA family oxidoreductase [Candidatus Paceibacterota bacterium]MDD3283769.1 Gfo/Idh/MocA family oxidoreductase [Candidatus Paceibacterota bacterium]MDD3969922.1 Gfo/Idh/MocA family oxidoreductase [Candidatus Paceibacterota bacterium]MDD4737821.1 Gfo/Idh/MocA family oxidoreductase [Candidatus Paceibacterota bacterium]
MENTKEINILLVGLGPHAKRIYFPILQREGSDFNSRISLIVDLEEKKEDIEQYLSTTGEKIETIYLSPRQKTYDNLCPEIRKILDQKIKDLKINAIFIATEPLSHMVYARYALSRGLNILMDKPLSTKENISTDIKMAKKIIDDYKELVILKNKMENKLGRKIVLNLMAQRRFHPAFLKVKELVNEVYKSTNCPITSIQSFHSDGQWRMPEEIIDQDYHPYNQGYGKLSHSGYHSFDLVPWLLDMDGVYYDKISIFSQPIRPIDFFEQLEISNYEKLFPDYCKFFNREVENIHSAVKKYGEIDCFSNISFMHKNKTLTLASINLVHNGFSQRGWITAKGRDLYKGNGRVRHESHYIEQGPFQAISFISYQGKEVDPNNLEGIYDIGGEYHLDIHVFRNNIFNPIWKNYEKISTKDLDINIMDGFSRGHQEDARRYCILDFIEQINNPDKDSKSSITNHENSVLLMSGAYQSMCKLFKGKNPLISIKIKK